MQKCNVLRIKLRPVKLFKSKKKNSTLQESGNSTTDGRNYGDREKTHWKKTHRRNALLEKAHLYINA